MPILPLSYKIQRHGKKHPPAYAWAREAAELEAEMATLRAERKAEQQAAAATEARLRRRETGLDVLAEDLRQREKSLEDREARVVQAVERRAAHRARAKRDDWTMPGPPPVTRFATPPPMTPGANTPFVRRDVAAQGGCVHASSRTKPL